MIKIGLRAHHYARLNQYLTYNRLRMFLSNWLWYGFKSAIYRHKVFSMMRKHHYTVNLVYSINDYICMNCKHKTYCATGNIKDRKWQMKLYENVFLDGKQHEPKMADEKVMNEHPELRAG